MTDNWRTLKINEIGRLVTGKTPSSSKPECFGDKYPFITPTDMHDCRYASTTARYLSEEGAAGQKTLKIPPGSVAVSCIGWQMGKSIVTTRPSFTNQQLHSILPNGEVDPLYLYYYLCTQRVKLLSLGSAAGVRTPIINKSAFGLLSIVVPPLPTQRKIASILSAYDDLIENNTRRIAILEEMAQAIYREWFVNFRFPGHENVKLVDSPLGQIPKGWEVAQLNEVADITMGTSPKSSTYNDEGKGTPLINGPVEFGDKFTQRVKWTTDPKRFCEAGDLVVCVRGSTTGKYVKSDDVYCLGRGVCGIRGKHQSFVDQLFAQELQSLLAQAGGSTFPSWTGPQLKSHQVLSPAAELVAQFDEHVSPKQQAIYVYSRKNECLRATRDLLLPKLISGKLDVEDLDIDVGMTTEALEEATA